MTIVVPMRRSYERATDGMRPVSIEPNPMPYAEGSALVKVGETHVICTASVDEQVPRWMKGRGTGWVTAEYSMLPRATKERTDREAAKGRQGGRTVEIQRLIGRALRAVVDMKALGLTINTDGTLALNSSTFDKTLAENPNAAARLLGKDGTLSDGLSKLLKSNLDTGTGTLTLPMPPVERERVLAVKRGEVPRDEVSAEITQLEGQVRDLLDNGLHERNFARTMEGDIGHLPPPSGA